MVLFKRYKLTVITILLPAILFLMWNSIVNLHSHHLANGVVISHAHPYNKLPDTQQHNHNNKEFFFLQQITSFLFCFFTVLVIIVLATPKIEVIRQLKLLKHGEILCFLYSNRAPPCSL